MKSIESLAKELHDFPTNHGWKSKFTFEKHPMKHIFIAMATHVRRLEIEAVINEYKRANNNDIGYEYIHFRIAELNKLLEELK